MRRMELEHAGILRISGGMIGFWNGPVAATTLSASKAPALVATSKPPPGFALTARTSTPVRIGASIAVAKVSK